MLYIKWKAETIIPAIPKKKTLKIKGYFYQELTVSPDLGQCRLLWLQCKHRWILITIDSVPPNQLATNLDQRHMITKRLLFLKPQSGYTELHRGILTPVDQAPAGQTAEKGQLVPARPPSSTESLTWNLHNAWGQERVSGSAEHFPGEYSPAVQRWVWLCNGNRNKWCFRFYFSAREPHSTGMLKYTDVCYFCAICWEAESANADLFFF